MNKSESNNYLEYICPDCGHKISFDLGSNEIKKCDNCMALLQIINNEIYIVGYQVGHKLEENKKMDKPIFVFSSLEQNIWRLQIAFNTRHCRHACFFCGIRNTGSEKIISESSMVKQLNYALKNKTRTEYDLIAIGCEGSILDENTFPKNVLEMLVKKLSEKFPKSIIQLETRIEYVKEKRIKELKSIHNKIGIKTSLETIDKYTRNKILGKNLNILDFNSGIKICYENDIPVTVFIILKPNYLHTEREAIEEAYHTCDYLINQAKVNKGKLTIRISAMYPVVGTKWANKARLNNFIPPKLEMMALLGKYVDSQGISCALSLWHELHCDFKDTFWIHDSSTYKSFTAIRKFSQTQDVEYLNLILSGNTGIDKRMVDYKFMIRNESN